MSLIPAGLAMFFGSIVGVLYRQNSTIATKQKYKQILSTLLAPVVNPTAQKNYAPGIDLEAIFQSRKKYFKSIMSTSLQRTKFIHIAGTKGKGSTTEYIAAGLRSQGYKVGVFTSPHIHSARERIKIGKTLIRFVP
jgi:dihydrofolate synthase/folylpolyglutamate synthase